ncbi:MAG TPA: TetR/AcrR family transcriptional regulator [Clostridia bacterium]|nr:TetR/AcrR family transcriptional regulator [Clostridia bacterium]
MQFKKSEVRESILKSSEEAFLKHGFEGASLRNIVTNANTSIGNFYNYFNSKEELFNTLVAHDYEMFMKLLSEHETVERPDHLWDLSNPKIWREVLSEFIVQFIPEFGNGFVLLIQSSKGTPYENTREVLIKSIEEHFVDHVNRFGENKDLIGYGSIMASQFVDGFTKIFLDYDDQKTRNKLLVDHLLFYMIGTMGMIGDF